MVVEREDSREDVVGESHGLSWGSQIQASKLLEIAQ